MKNLASKTRMNYIYNQKLKSSEAETLKISSENGNDLGSTVLFCLMYQLHTCLHNVYGYKMYVYMVIKCI